MKKTMVSLAAASLIATTAMAADKGIDIVTTGQATIYYETADTAGDDLFDQSKSSANVGVQLNLDADLKNGFSFGSQLTYLGTAGLEKNLVSGTRQSVTTTGAMNDISDEIALTKIFVAKKVANTTVKIGRQELPKSLSPLAFSEGWNVYKNTFEAILAINTDIPNTTLVGAYVSQSNNSKGDNFATFDNLTAGQTGVDVGGTAYMLTAQTTAVPMATITASYYALGNIKTADAGLTADNQGANALWLDAKIAPKDLPMGLKFAVQGGSISPEASELKDTTAFGAKVGLSPVKALNVCLAYTSVDDGTVAIVNTGTGVKTPLYTQMIANQNAISLDADTFMLSGMYNFGDAGKVIARGTMTSAGTTNRLGDGNDYTDLELIYKTKVSATNLMVAYLNTTKKDDDVSNHVIRVVARYNF